MNALSSAVVALSVSLSALVAPLAQPASATSGDDVIAWVEVEDGQIVGGPGFNSGDHGNFSGTGSYTFRETGMMSTMKVTAPAAGVYPVYVRYAAGPLGADENVTRSMGLLTNGGSRQLMSLPMTSFTDWETWRFVEYDVTLEAGANTIAIQCDRSTDFCRLNFDAIQVGGTAPDPCPATPPQPGYAAMFDGTFASFDDWRKAGAGGFGRQTDCYIRGYGGQGATWYTHQQSGSYTLRVDWRRRASDRESSVYLASTSRAGATPVGGFRIPIGTGTGSIVPTGGTVVAADATAVAAALKPVGQWNTYTIQVTPSRLRVLLNGTAVSTLAGTVATTGYVGLENRAAGPVEFANIQVLHDIELGRVTAPAQRAAAGESALGNLVAEAERRATGATIALVDPDDLGADLVGRAGGYPAVVTQQEAALMLPSDDSLVTTHLTGQQLRSVLEERGLGTSAGLTYTYDPTAAPGQRVTGIWLDGTPVDPAASYTVAAVESLALGGVDQHDTGLTGLDALVGYLEAGGDVTPDSTQHAVGVAFPGGQPATYLPGDAIAVDLSSFVLAGPSDPKDTGVQASVGGRSLGSFPVDEQGRAAVRATVPADMPAGATTLTLVGPTTGTTVRLPITVAARPPVSVPPPVPPVVQKATPKVVVTAQPKRVVAGRTRPAVAVVVSAPGLTPTGTVKVKVGARTYVAQLRNGRTVVRLAKVRKPGTVRATVSYLGDPQVAPASGAVRIKVVRPRRR